MINLELKEKQVKYIYDYLVDIQRLDLIDLMARSSDSKGFIFSPQSIHLR